MKAIYQGALVGFTDDLTKDRAATYPIAAIVVGYAGPIKFAAVGSLGLGHLPTLDPLTEEFLQDVPALLRYHIDSVLETVGPLDTEAGLKEVAGVLRNTLHVVKILPPRRAEVTAQNDLRALLSDAVLECLGIEPNALLSDATEPGLKVPEFLLWQLDSDRKAIRT